MVMVLVAVTVPGLSGVVADRMRTSAGRDRLGAVDWPGGNARCGWVSAVGAAHGAQATRARCSAHASAAAVTVTVRAPVVQPPGTQPTSGWVVACALHHGPWSASTWSRVNRRTGSCPDCTVSLW